MIKILAPTRGGQASYVNQDRAISLAKEQGAELSFLYITDISFLEHHSVPILINLEDDLDEMGGFVLTMAQERASKQGIEAQALVRRGHFGDVLSKVIEEGEFDCLILGNPQEDSGITTFDFLQELAEGLADARQIETIVVEKGEVVYRHGPG